MTYNTLIYSITIFSLLSWLLRHFKHSVLLSTFGVIVCNLPIILSLSITQWLDSICGNPSLLLALLSLGSLLSLPQNPFARYFLPTRSTFALSTSSKLYLVLIGFILFWGNINYLLGLDLFNADFYIQVLSALLIVVVAYFIQPYLGVLLLLSCVGYFIGGGEIFSYMMDALVWLYALLSVLLSPFVRKSRA